MSEHVKFQLGKNGLASGFIDSLNLALKNNKQLRISVLKSFSRNREELEKTAKEIGEKLPTRVRIKLIGFTIVLSRTSKPKTL